MSWRPVQHCGNNPLLQKTAALAARARLLPHRTIEKPSFTQPFPAAQQLIFCPIPTSGQFPIILGGRQVRRPICLALPSHRRRLSLVWALTSAPGFPPTGCLLTICSRDRGRTLCTSVGRTQMDVRPHLQEPASQGPTSCSVSSK